MKIGDDDIGAAAQAMEAYFLRQLMKEMRGTTPGLMDGGIAGSTFRDMLDEALSDKMAEASGLGVAETIMADLKKTEQP